MLELLSLNFMQNALISVLIVSILCGIIGSLVVINRMSFIAGGIAHGAYGGIGLAFFIGFSPILGASIFAVILGLTIAFLTAGDKKGLDSSIGAIWAFGMAFGIILLDLTPGYRTDLMSYLFGSILAVSYDDIKFMSVVLIICLLCISIFYRQIVAVSFDSSFAKLRGINSKLFYYLIILLVSLCIVAMIRVVGIILVIALLTIPPYITQSFCTRLGIMMSISALLAITFCLLGLWLSFELNLTSGASIIAVASITFFICGFAKLLRR